MNLSPIVLLVLCDQRRFPREFEYTNRITHEAPEYHAGDTRKPRLIHIFQDAIEETESRGALNKCLLLFPSPSPSLFRSLRRSCFSFYRTPRGCRPRGCRPRGNGEMAESA